MSAKKRSKEEARIAAEARSAGQQMLDPHRLDHAEEVSLAAAALADARRRVEQAEEEFGAAWNAALKSGNWKATQLDQLPAVEHRPQRVKRRDRSSSEVSQQTEDHRAEPGRGDDGGAVPE